MIDPARDNLSDKAVHDFLAAIWTEIRKRPDLAAAAARFARWAADHLEAQADSPKTTVKAPSHPAIELPTKPVVAPAAPKSMVINLGGTRQPLSVPGADDVDPPEPEILDTRRTSWIPGAVRPTTATWTPRDPTSASRDLTSLSKRARLKAQACHWLMDRRRTSAAHAPLSGSMQEHLNGLLDQARSIPNCYLWMVRPGHEVESDEAVELAAAAYENVARVADLLKEATDEDADNVSLDLLHLAAEAQSALRNALPGMHWEKEPDQLQMFYWLRDYAEEHRTFISRHMKLDDPADPAAHEDLHRRLQEFADTTKQQRQAVQRRKDLVGHVRYQARALANAADDEQREQARERLDHFLGQWVEIGLPPTDKQIREAVLTIVDRMPDDDAVAPGTARVLRAAREYAQFATANGEETVERVKTRPDHVREAAELTRDLVAVFVGGEERVDQRQRIERDLELREVRWLPTLEHEALARLEPDVSRPDVDLVLLAIRLTSHSHGDLKRICEDHGKIFVTLPAGWNPSQVADQVLNQASERLQQRRESRASASSLSK